MTSVIFNLSNSQDNNTYGRIWISPIAAPVSYSSSLITGDTLVLATSATNPIRTISLVPNQYRVRCLEHGSNSQTEFYIVVPETNGGTLNVADITTGSYTTGSWITMSYATNAGTASYALNGPWSYFPDIIDDGAGHVGINQPTPNFALDVVGTVGCSTGGFNIIGTNDSFINSSTGNINVQSFGGGNVLFFPYGIGTGGFVGIGTQDPRCALDVNGKIGTSVSGSVANYVVFDDGAGDTHFQGSNAFNIYTNNNNLVIDDGSSTNNASWTTNKGNIDISAGIPGYGNSQILQLNAIGGITMSPGLQPVAVNGTVNITGGGSLKLNNTPILAQAGSGTTYLALRASDNQATMYLTVLSNGQIEVSDTQPS